NKWDRSAVVQRCLSQLSPRHREVIDLVYYHEKSIDEVARIVGASENTVKTRMFYARSRMENLLKVAGVESSRTCAESVVCANLRCCSPKEEIFKLVLRIAIISLLLATSAGLAQDRKATPLEEHGRALAQRMCSACHAVGRSDESPHVGAPPFRALDRRVE